MSLRWPIFLWMLSSAVSARAQTAERVPIKLLGFNDFHGQLSAGRERDGRPVGSAAVLGAYLRAETERAGGASLIVHAGDFVGGSPHASSLLQDEPAIEFLNLLGNQHCDGSRDLRCNVVGTLGNHEFDEGVPELLRLVRGGSHVTGSFLEQPYRGAKVPYVCANVLDERTGKPLLPPYVVRDVAGLRVAVIGAVLSYTPNIVLPEGLRGWRFEDEAEAINSAVRQLRKRGVRAIVVAIHQGAGMLPYEGFTQRNVRLPPESDLADIVGRLDGEVDVVVSGHAHQFSNAYHPAADGREVLVVQAYSAGMAYADVELVLSRAQGEVVEKRARIVPTYADEGPGRTPAADIAALTARAERMASELLARVVGRAPEPIRDVPNAAGESALGNFIADAQRAATKSQVAFVNQGAIRAELPAGDVTWARLLAVQPFGGVVLAVELTGAQLRRVLEQQWEYTPPHMLQVSGLHYRWDAALPVGSRVVAVRVGDEPLREDATYRVAVSDYLGRGGAGFPTLAESKRREVGPRDIDAVHAFLVASGGVARARIEARIVRRD